MGRRVYPQLVKLERVKPPVYSVAHYVRNEEALGHLARRYGTSVRSIQQYNGLSGTIIRPAGAIQIPLRGVSAAAIARLVVPDRLLPPLHPGDPGRDRMARRFLKPVLGLPALLLRSGFPPIQARGAGFSLAVKKTSPMRATTAIPP